MYVIVGHVYGLLVVLAEKMLFGVFQKCVSFEFNF